MRTPNPAALPIPEKLNVFLVFVQAVLILVSLKWTNDATGAWRILPVVLFCLTAQSIYFLVHEASHGHLHRQRWINDGLGRLAAVFFPTSFSFVTAAHLSHHQVNRTDAELFDYIREGENPVLRIIAHYLQLAGLLWVGQWLLSILVAATPRFLVPVVLRRLDRHSRRFFAFIMKIHVTRIRAEVLLAAGIWTLVVWGLDLRGETIALCYAVFAPFYSSQQHVYHRRTIRHVIEGSRDLRLPTPLRWAYLNSNYHLQHHRHPGVPWIHLPQLADLQHAESYLRYYPKVFEPPKPLSLLPPA